MLKELRSRSHAPLQLEYLGATCREFRAIRTDPDIILRLCETHGFSARTRERFYPGLHSLCKAEGFYRRVVSSEYALRTDAELECAVVAGDVSQVATLLAFGASVHLPDYALLKQTARQRRANGCNRALRLAACHSNGYTSDEMDTASPLLLRAAVCGHAEVCKLLLRASGNLAPERVMPLACVSNWGARRLLGENQKWRVVERNERNDAAEAAYECDQFETLQLLMDMGATVAPSASHDQQAWNALRMTAVHEAVVALHVLFRIAKPSSRVLSDMLNEAIAQSRVSIARELVAQGARLAPFDGVVQSVCAQGESTLLDLLLPMLRSAPKSNTWSGIDRELRDGLYIACRRLADWSSIAQKDALPTESRAAYVTVALRLLDEGALPVGRTSGGGCEQRPGAFLVLACQAGEPQLVQRLIEAGEPPDADDGLPMKFAFAGNHVEVIRLLNDALVPVLNERLRASRA